MRHQKGLEADWGGLGSEVANADRSQHRQVSGHGQKRKDTGTGCQNHTPDCNPGQPGASRDIGEKQQRTAERTYFRGGVREQRSGAASASLVKGSQADGDMEKPYRTLESRVQTRLSGGQNKTGV